MNYPLPCLFPNIGGQFLLWNPMSPQVEVRSGHYAKCVCVCMSLCVSICFSNYTVKGQRGGLLSFISVPQVPTEQVIVTACGWKDVTTYDNHRWPPTKKSATRDGIDEKTGRASSWCLGGGVGGVWHNDALFSILPYMPEVCSIHCAWRWKDILLESFICKLLLLVQLARFI